MRLLNSNTLRFVFFQDDREVPPYAILSHTWGSDEVLFEEVQAGPLSKHDERGGAWKISRCAEQAKKDGYEYFWVDTCCIQKSSSAELSEAINSMFRWYKNAAICYAYLEDVPQQPPQMQERGEEWFEWQLKFMASRWFTRGWTLQELIAPRHLQFFSQEWEALARKEDYAFEITALTKIPKRVLLQGDLALESVACRMSWAAKRKTTRVEDMAYCLLGIFDVNMPLLYGEGERAFQRLQEEIINVSDDDSIFAWRAAKSTFATWRGLLAHSASEFANSGTFVTGDDFDQEPHAINTRTIRVRLPLHKRTEFGLDEPEDGWKSRTEYVAVLRCGSDSRSHLPSYVGIFIKRINGNGEHIRVDANRFIMVPRQHPHLLHPEEWSTISFSRRLGVSPWRSCTPCFRVRGFFITAEERLFLYTCSPPDRWNEDKKLFLFDAESMAKGQLQEAICILASYNASGIGLKFYLILKFEPRTGYRGSTCESVTENGGPQVEVRCALRIIDGETFNVVSLRLRPALIPPIRDMSVRNTS